ncbi:hypothetical protein [Spongiimicrobium sp. 3-5]|uniref:hypothetical protein n=1 Tax=Spongiimicrobium sp. 3-5 TaxID=3332596 RepID=UPI0039801685
MEGSAKETIFFVDGVVLYEVSNNDTPSFYQRFSLFQYCMGDTLRGVIDAGLLESMMEVNYIRLYK